MTTLVFFIKKKKAAQRTLSACFFPPVVETRVTLKGTCFIKAHLLLPPVNTGLANLTKTERTILVIYCYKTIKLGDF